MILCNFAKGNAFFLSGRHNFCSFSTLKEKLKVEKQKKMNKKREKTESLKMGKYKCSRGP